MTLPHPRRARSTKAPIRGLALTLAVGLVAGSLGAQNGDRPGHVMTEVWRDMEVPPAPVLSAEEGLAALRVAPGFRVELVASEPLVEDPVAITWDPRGRLWAVEMRGFMPNVDGIGEDRPVGQIVVLDDSDRDGVMDQKSVFLDGLVMPRALAIVHEGVLIAEPPHLWLCRDDDGDDRCDRKTEVARYGDPDLDYVEHTENGLLWGLDNWLYSAKSDRKLRWAHGRIDERATAFRGQWGISQDDAGHLYYNTNSRWLLGDLYVPEGHFRNTADRPGRLPGVGARIVPAEDVFTVRVNPGINRGYQPDMLRDDGRLERTTSVSGLCVYRGHQYPASYVGDVFIPEPAGNVVGLFELRRDDGSVGAEHVTYPDPDWGRREFLASPDERFRPVDCAVGPDGAVTIIDMYRGILQHRQYVTTFLRKQILERGLERPLGLGRIYRVVADGRPIDHSRPRLASVEEQIAALEHPNGWHRDTAQRLLVETAAPESIEPLRRMAATSPSPLARLHALWSLHGIAERSGAGSAERIAAIDLDLVETALASTDRALQLASLRVASALDPSSKARLLPRLLELSSESTVDLARAAVFALGESEDEAAVRRLIELSRSASPDLRLAAISGLGEREVDVLAELLPEGCLAEEPCAASAVSLFRAALRRRDRPAAVRAFELLASALADQASREPAKRLAAAVSELVDEEGFEAFGASAPAALETIARHAGPEIAGKLSAVWLVDRSGSAPEYDVATAKALFRSCSSCHDDGTAASGLAPTLAGARLATGPPEALIKLVLDGVTGPLRSGDEMWNDLMPGFRSDRRFTDAGIAALASYVRSSWGNDAGTVTAQQVREVRERTSTRQQPWSVSELSAGGH